MKTQVSRKQHCEFSTRLIHPTEVTTVVDLRVESGVHQITQNNTNFSVSQMTGGRTKGNEQCII